MITYERSFICLFVWGYCLTAFADSDMPFTLDEHDSDVVVQAQAHIISAAQAQAVAQLFKALSDPTRVRLISLLSTHELCVHTIVEVMGMTQSAISHQLQTLRVLRVVRSRKEGKHVYYTLSDSHIGDLFKQGVAQIQHG